MEPVLVIVNAAAGSSGADAADRALGLLRAAGDVQTASPSDAAELEAVLDRRGHRRLVVAGGDGSLHRVIEALHHRGELAGVVLGLVPLGTGNDFARGAGIPLDPEAAARLIRDGDPGPVDLIIDDDDEVVVNNVHVGVSAEASRLGARWKQRVGRLGYGIGFVQAGFRRPLRLRVEVDGVVVADGHRPLLEVSIGNGATVGGGLQLNPGADPLRDGLDVVVAFATSVPERIGYAIDLVRARQGARADVWQGTAEQVTVSGEAFYASSDGEIDGPDPLRRWRRAAGAFRMLLPPG